MKLKIKIMDMSKYNDVNFKNEHQKINVDELMKENMELMYKIQKNRNEFCMRMGGC